MRKVEPKPQIPQLPKLLNGLDGTSHLYLSLHTLKHYLH